MTRSSKGYIVRLNCDGFTGGCNQTYSYPQLENVSLNSHDKLLIITDANVQVDTLGIWEDVIYLDSTYCSCVNPIPAFLYEIDSLTVGFSNTTSCGQPFLWTFGDGNSSSDSSPLHTYEEPGIYQVCLEVFSGCDDSSTFCDTITVCPCADTMPSFSYEIDVYTVTFSNNTQCDQPFLWTFGDGDTSTESSPIHAYQTHGMYQICLKAFSGCDTLSFCETVNIEEIVDTEELDSVVPNIKVFPNPFTHHTSLYISNGILNSENPMIVDLSGRRIRTIPLEGSSADLHFTWDGKGDNGTEVDPGVYFLRVKTSESKVIYKKMIKIN